MSVLGSKPDVRHIDYGPTLVLIRTTRPNGSSITAPLDWSVPYSSECCAAPGSRNLVSWSWEPPTADPTPEVPFVASLPCSAKTRSARPRARAGGTSAIRWSHHQLIRATVLVILCLLSSR